MDINDYLIQQDGKNWKELLSEWRWLLPSVFTIWMVNRFGDIIMTFDDGSVHILTMDRGTISRIAESKDDFCAKVDQGGNANDWFMIPLVDQCVKAGMKLGSDQCYNWKIAPILGGSYSTENMEVTDMSVHYSIFGQIHEQIKSVPDGTPVTITLSDRT